MVRQVASGCAALFLGAVGGAIFWWFNLPLPWMMGSMVAAAIAAIGGVPVPPLNPLRPTMLAVVGTMLGASFSASFFLSLPTFAVPLIGLTVSSFAAATIALWVLRRFAGLSSETAYFCAMPGGVIEMVTLAHERGGDDRIVALVHASRIFLVVLCLPFLFEWLTGTPAARGSGSGVTLADVSVTDASWFLGVVAAGFALSMVVHLPARFMLAPMIVSMIVHVAGWTDFKLPFELIAIAQVVIGVGIGARFANVDRRLIMRTMGLSILVSVILVAVSIVGAMVVSQITGIGLASLMLSYAPGGLAEMSLIALAMQLDVAFVVANHLFRVILIIACAGLFFDVMKRRGWI